MNDNYVRQILNHDEDRKNSSLNKNFWKYIKSRKKDSMGISPLQNLPGMYIIDGKAEILNKQYDSVFTDKPRTDTTTWKLLSTIYRPTQYTRERSLHITEERQTDQTRYQQGY